MKQALIRSAALTAVLMAWAAAAEPPAATAAPAISIGVGAIRWRDDYTDAAFDLTRWAELNPFGLKGRRTRVFLVDFPTDAEWFVSGELTGNTSIDVRAATFEGEVGGKFTIRHQGKKVSSFTLPAVKISRSVSDRPISRRELLEALWKALAFRIRTEVEAAP